MISYDRIFLKINFLLSEVVLSEKLQRILIRMAEGKNHPINIADRNDSVLLKAHQAFSRNVAYISLGSTSIENA
jgi:hypothetical protein